MSTPYAGADSFPVDVVIPDDGEDITASSVDTPFEAALDRTKWLRNRLPTHKFLALAGVSGSFVVPASVTWIEGLGMGGGGGGGAGAGDTLGLGGIYWPGGGGGGGARASIQRVAVTPGETLTYVKGAGGAGGLWSGGGLTFPGDGADTTLSRAGTPIMTFRGAGRAHMAFNAYSDNALLFQYQPGGFPVRHVVPGGTEGMSGTAFFYLDQTPGAGGAGATKNMVNLRPGNSSPEGFLGGIYGASGTTDGVYPGGGAGAGGGASSFGVGGAGGNGGGGNAAGVGADASGGGAGAGPGGGGGGGGAGGTGSVAGSSGESGGSGGPGLLTLYWTEVGTL